MMAGFTYSPVPEDHPTDSDTFYARKAKRERDAMAAKLAANPVKIPSLSDIYREHDADLKREQEQRRAQIASDPYAFDARDMPLPKNDPKAIAARNKIINGE